MRRAGLIGDRVLVALGELFTSLFGSYGLIGRYGGEEFCIALFGKSIREVEILGEQLRASVASAQGWLPNAEPVTVSVGIACQKSGDDIDGLMRRADQALYAAKENGRNRVVNLSNEQNLLQSHRSMSLKA